MAEKRLAVGPERYEAAVEGWETAGHATDDVVDDADAPCVRQQTAHHLMGRISFL